MMDKYFKVSNMLFSLIATLSSFKKKKKERCDFITRHLTDFAMLYVSSCKANSKESRVKNHQDDEYVISINLYTN